MYIIENSVDGKWHYLCQTPNLKEALQRIKLYAVDDVIWFKTCDAERVRDSETNEILALYPEDFTTEK